MHSCVVRSSSRRHLTGLVQKDSQNVWGRQYLNPSEKWVAYRLRSSMLLVLRTTDAPVTLLSNPHGEDASVRDIADLSPQDYSV